MMQQTFISYSTKDEATAIQIYDGLKARGINCWIACIGLQLCPGAAWQSEIINALEDSSVMLLIFSSNVNESEQILKEISVADDNGIVIIPLKIDNAPFTGGYNFELKNRQHIQLYNDIDKRLDEIADTIKYLTAKKDEFVNAVRENYSENKGIANDLERDYLLGEGTKMGLKRKEAEKIIAHVFGSSNNQESEEEYLNLIDKVLEDRVVSAIEKKLLEQKAKNLGISDFRAQELLTQAKEKLGIFDAPITESVMGEAQHIIEASKPLSNDIYLAQKDDNEAKNSLSAEQLNSNLISTAISDDELLAQEKIKLGGLDVNKDVVSNISSSNLHIKSSSPTIWHLNTGGRSWVDQMRYHYWTAGGGKRYKETIHKIKIGDEVYAYMSKRGYVAHGFVIGKPTILNDYICMSGVHKDQKLIDLPIEPTTLKAFDSNNNLSDADEYEYTLPVEWVSAFNENEAKFKEGLDISPLTGCKLSSPKILDFLKLVFAEPLNPNSISTAETDEVSEVGSQINTISIIGLLLNFTVRNIKAQGQMTNDGFLVLAGSDFSATITPSLPSNVIVIRDALIEADILKMEGENYKLLKDTLFSTSSNAAMAIAGTSRSGPQSWKDSQGLTIKDIEEQYLIDVNVDDREHLTEEYDLNNEMIVNAGDLTDSEDDLEDLPRANTPLDKTRSSSIKNLLTISGKMHVSTLKRQFSTLFGLTLRVYDGRSFADEKATIANIRKVDNKVGEYSPGNNTKLVTIENKMFEVFGLKVQIWGSDDSYTCNRELTLKQAKIEDDKKIERKKTKNIKAKDTMDTKD